mmetsp:Transcript_38574/g.110808  ORF Transcript_38574/g.110808 Transcript_38574/m.110808 type:complete len:208 (-) Transcript_38574:263-886(-)
MAPRCVERGSESSPAAFCRAVAWPRAGRRQQGLGREGGGALCGGSVVRALADEPLGHRGPLPGAIAVPASLSELRCPLADVRPLPASHAAAASGCRRCTIGGRCGSDVPRGVLGGRQLVGVPQLWRARRRPEEARPLEVAADVDGASEAIRVGAGGTGLLLGPEAQLLGGVALGALGPQAARCGGRLAEGAADLRPRRGRRPPWRSC